MELLESLKQKVTQKPMTLVFPEGNDERIVNATIRLASENLLTPIVLGKREEILKLSRTEQLPENLQILDPATYPAAAFEEMVAAFVARRNGKNTAEQAREMLKDVNYFGTMLVYLGKADGMVSGAIHATGDTVRPALQIIKTKPNVRRTSGAFLMLREDERYIFSDCAINIDPTAQDLAEIAVESAKTARLFDIDPKVALMSFSTKGSASSPVVDKVIEAVKLAKQLAPNEEIDGELQFDAAFVPSVAAKKAPDSKVAGYANVFVFPELQSGNIGYKIAQRLGGFEAVGPILQGLNQPVSDLSRGCDEEEIYKVSLITAGQAIDEE
ncbi:phosphate acetyltransferase [Ligilactobacillus apodemi]|uniref:phosphate acetyltransferase n=1 Tax=Ligilactobacillus apodemi TaxID=307126 RepID=UPI00214B03F8|nr:phosphate acetyltransferase [Ligilactobacillus apodemi]MCR1902173.1 phosphate acetyltransferase [Ligilactobacillus apodemi]